MEDYIIMYPDLDEAIHTALTTSTRGNLNRIKTFYYGDPQLQNTPMSIAIAHTADNLNNQTFNDEDREQAYVLKIRIKKMNYLSAMQTLRDVVTDIKDELHTNTDFSYKDFMTVGDIVPIYTEKGVLRECDMQLLFRVEEDYTPDVDTFDEIEIIGDISDD